MIKFFDPVLVPYTVLTSTKLVKPLIENAFDLDSTIINFATSLYSADAEVNEDLEKYF